MKRTLLTFILLLLTTKSVFGQISDINKTTGWYMTNECFQGQVDVERTNFSGFNLDHSPYYPHQWNPRKDYYWAFIGIFNFCDLDNDGINNLVQSYYHSPWPNNNEKPGGVLHSKSSLTEGDYTFTVSLSHIRKQIVTDFNNDGINEVLLISHGMDTDPLPGDSIAIFHVTDDTFQYLTDNIGFYHGGAVGDIDRDGDQDIVLGFRETGRSKLKDHPTVYINQGDFEFKYDNSMFINFPQDSGPITWFTLELYDLNNDGYLDLFVSGYVPDSDIDAFYIIYNEEGIFDYNNHIIVETPYGSNSSNTVLDFDFYDFNFDGRTDILVNTEVDGYQSGESFIYINQSYTSFENQTQEFTPNGLKGIPGLTWWAWNYLYDIDNDGDMDIIPQGLYGFGYRQKEFFYFKNTSGKFYLTPSTPISGGYYTNIEQNVVQPTHYNLKQNYPNPFNPTTQIEFSLAQSTSVRLEVYSLLGQRVSTLIDGNVSMGNHTLSFDGKNLSSGIYIYRLTTPEYSQLRIMNLVK